MLNLNGIVAHAGGKVNTSGLGDEPMPDNRTHERRRAPASGWHRPSDPEILEIATVLRSAYGVAGVAAGAVVNILVNGRLRGSRRAPEFADGLLRLGIRPTWRGVMTAYARVAPRSAQAGGAR